MALTKDQWSGLYGGAAGIGSGLAGLFGGGKNPADAANKYIGQIPGQTSPYLNPWFQAGQQAIPGLQEQYAGLMGDPGGMLNKIGEHYQQSPGLHFAIQQALQGAGHAAAAGGMAGSPQHEQQNEQLANDLAAQDYYKWLGGATGLYGQGLAGQQGLSQQGQQAGQSMADIISQALAQQANLAYAGQQAKNQQQSGSWGDILGGIGKVASSIFL